MRENYRLLLTCHKFSADLSDYVTNINAQLTFPSTFGQFDPILQVQEWDRKKIEVRGSIDKSNKIWVHHINLPHNPKMTMSITYTGFRFWIEILQYKN